MRYLLLRFVTLLLLVLVFLVSLMELIHAASPKDSIPFSEIFQPDLTCALPCWRGIQPGQTTVDRAYQILANDLTSISNLSRIDTEMVGWTMPILPSRDVGIVAYHVFGRPGHEVQAIRFDLPYFPKFRLADAIALWGTPTNVVLYYCSGADSDHALADIRFTGNIEVRTVEFFNNWYGRATPAVVNLNPGLQLIMVRYYADSFDMSWQWSRLPRWRGFNTWPVGNFGHTNMCGM